MFDPIRIAAALLPLGCYWLVMGQLRWRKHPTVLSRSFDAMLLGMGMVGLVAVGPIELFFPRAAFSLVGNWVWLVLLCLYFLLLLLIVFNIKPGVILYGLRKEPLRQLINEWLIAQQIHYVWLEDVLRVESLGIQGILSDAGWNDVSSFQAIGSEQNLSEWIRLEQELAANAQKIPREGSHVDVLYITLSAVAFIIAFSCLAWNTQALEETISMLFNE